jgi:heat shock protein HtpX
VNVVDEMAIASGLTRPRIWIVPDDDPNAFATGHDEHTAHIAVTRGLLTMLSRSELQAVVAHEMGHVKTPRRAPHDASCRDGGRDRPDQ